MVAKKKFLRFYVHLIPIVLVISCGSQSSDPSKLESNEKGEISVDSVLSHIQKEIHAIDSNTSFESINVDVFGLSTEGGEVLALIDGGVMRKAIVTFYGETGKRTDEYYFENDRLIYLFRQNFEYDKPIYIEGSTIAAKKEARFFFHEGQLIRWINPSNELVDPHSEEADEVVNSIYEDVVIILKAAKSSKKEVFLNE